MSDCSCFHCMYKYIMCLCKHSLNNIQYSCCRNMKWEMMTHMIIAWRHLTYLLTLHQNESTFQPFRILYSLTDSIFVFISSLVCSQHCKQIELGVLWIVTFLILRSDICQLKRSRGRDVAAGSGSQRSDILSVLVTYNIFNSCAVLCSLSPWELPGWGSGRLLLIDPTQ